MTDGAGNASVRGSDLNVVNHPPVTVTPTPVPTRTPVPTGDAHPGAELGGVDAGQALHGQPARRADGRGELAGASGGELRGVAVAAREASGPHAHGHDRERQTSLKPGAKTRVTVKLSAAARRAVAKRSLRATLTLAGARPASVTLVPVRRE